MLFGINKHRNITDLYDRRFNHAFIVSVKQYRGALMVAVLGATTLLNGCETISGNSIGFPVHTKPEGASVNVFRSGTTHELSCTTPCHLHLRQTHDYTVTIRKSGYVKRVIAVKSDGSVEGAAGSLGSNLLMFGIGAPVGWVIDAASGGDDRLFPGSVNIKLIKAIDYGKQINTRNTAVTSATIISASSVSMQAKEPTLPKSKGGTTTTVTSSTASTTSAIMHPVPTQ
jgi:hypothetical protein